MIGIYKIENQLNNMIYIGQSKNIAQRWKNHRASAKKENTPLYCAIRKYGIENFTFEVIEECEIEQLNDREIYWIAFYNSYKKGYNQTPGGEGNHSPLKLTENQVLEIYEKLKGTETMEKIAKDYGVTHPTISNINTGIIWVHPNIEYPIRKKGFILGEKEQNYCIDCGTPIWKTSVRCKQCESLHRRKDKPVSREELKQLIRTTPFTKIGKMFGVSDNAIRKWCVSFDLPKRSIDIKKYTDEEWEKI